MQGDARSWFCSGLSDWGEWKHCGQVKADDGDVDGLPKGCPSGAGIEVQSKRRVADQAGY